MNKIKEWLLVIGLFSVVDIIWRLLEIIIYGETQPSWADSIIGVVLVLSLYANLLLLTDDK